MLHRSYTREEGKWLLFFNPLYWKCNFLPAWAEHKPLYPNVHRCELLVNFFNFEQCKPLAKLPRLRLVSLKWIGANHTLKKLRVRCSSYARGVMVITMVVYKTLLSCLALLSCLTRKWQPLLNWPPLGPRKPYTSCVQISCLLAVCFNWKKDGVLPEKASGICYLDFSSTQLNDCGICTSVTIIMEFPVHSQVFTYKLMPTQGIYFQVHLLLRKFAKYKSN